MHGRFRSPLLAAAATLVLITTLGLGARVATSRPAALRPGVPMSLGQAAGTGSLLGEQRWYKMLSFKLGDQLGIKVNVANGNLVVAQKVLDINGTGLDLSIGQYYNSLASGTGIVGSHWRLSLSRDVSLQFPGNGSAVFNAPTGYPVTFASQGGTFLDPPGLDASLVKNSSGTYTLTYHQKGESLAFDSAGVLTSEVDRNGNTISFAYGTGGEPQSIKDTQGRVVQFTNGSNGLVSKITDSTGRAALYTYDSAGNLLTFTDLAGGQTQFAYDGSSNVTQVTDPAGHVFKPTYDGSHRVTSIASATAATTSTVSATSSPSPAPSVTASPSPAPSPSPSPQPEPTTSIAYGTGTTTVTDPNGNKSTYTSDSSGRVTQVVDANNNTSKKTYTADNSPAQITDGLNNATTVSYDSLNNVTEGQAVTGARASALYGDSGHPYLVTQATDPQANVTKYTYDGPGNVTQVTDALGHPTKYAYNANGTPSSLTDAAGNVTTYQYDSAGNLTAVFPNSSSFTYDSLSRVISKTDARAQQTTYSYDALDRVTKVTYADGTSLSKTYDADGNLTRLVESAGTTSFGYDSQNRLVSKTLPSGEVIGLGYDAGGNLTSRKDGGGTTTYTYNSLELTDSVTDPAGARTTFQYDADQRLVSTAYPNGVTVQYQYDGANDVTSVTARTSSGVLLQRRYSYVNGTGQQTLELSAVSDESGVTTTYGYDALNRLTSANSSGNGTTDARKYSYDAVGNRISQTINGVTTDYKYDLSNGTMTGGSLTYTFDDDGSLTRRSDGLTLSYDAANLTSSEATTTTTAMTYSGIDQSHRVSEGTTSFVYDPTGLTRIAISGGETTYVTRSPGRNLMSERTSAGTYYFVTDALGSTIGLTAADGSLAATWTYDPWGGVVKSTGSVSTPLLFQGGYADFEGMYYMGERYYDPGTGRYLQPTNRGGGGTPADPRTLNPYVYQLDNPTNVTPALPDTSSAP